MSDQQPYEPPSADPPQAPQQAPQEAPQEAAQPAPAQPPQPSQPYDWREARRQERREYREERRAARGSGGAWVWGLFLILLGVVFLLDNTGLFHLQNWWALFILLPAVGSFQAAWNLYRSAGNRLDSAARGSLIGGFVLTLIALIFLFGMNFSLLWPILLLVAGAGLLLNALLPR